MLENIIVTLIVLACVALSLRWFYRAWKGDSGCGCGKASCGAAPNTQAFLDQDLSKKNPDPSPTQAPAARPPADVADSSRR